MSEASLFDAIPSPNPEHFDGDAYDPIEDDVRLTGQLQRVFHLMSDGAWHTVSQIVSMTGDPATSLPAQLRHLRKDRFGSYLVERRKVEGSRGLYQYRLGAKGAGRKEPTDREPTDAVTVTLMAADRLRSYARHDSSCFAIRTLVSDGLGQCTCGLDTVRAVYDEARRRTRS